MKVLFQIIVAVSAFGWLGVLNPVSAQHYDVLTEILNGKLVNGGYNDSNNSMIAPLRVFEGEVVPSGGLGSPYESEAPGEPGFRAVDQATLNGPAMTPSGVYTALPAITPLLFDFLPMTLGANTRNLLYWDGTGAVNFTPVPSSYELSLFKPGGGGYTVTIDGDDASLVAGNSIQTTSSVGGVHVHLFTQLDVNDMGNVDPAQGFYLYSLQFRMSGLETSDPAFFVFGAFNPSSMTSEQLDEFELAHGAAAGWVEANLVPEPTGFIFGSMAGVIGLFAWRQRRRTFA